MSKSIRQPPANNGKRPVLVATEMEKEAVGRLADTFGVRRHSENTMPP